MAVHMSNFRGFRCRLKVRHSQIPEYEVVTQKPVCFIRRPPPILITIDNSTVPDHSHQLIQRDHELHIYQVSCVRPGEKIVFTCSEWREIDTCDFIASVDTIYDMDTDLIIYVKHRNEYVLKSPVYDRLGRGRVEIPSIRYDWHVAEVVCHQKVHVKGADTIKPIMDEFSTALRLCVSQLEFTFYLTHVGFDKTKGLTMSIDELKKRNALDVLDTRVVHSPSEGSAVICEVTDRIAVVDTLIKLQNRGSSGGQGNLIQVFGTSNSSVAILPAYDVNRRTDTITLYCETTRQISQIPAKSKVRAYGLTYCNHHLW